MNQGGARGPVQPLNSQAPRVVAGAARVPIASERQAPSPAVSRGQVPKPGPAQALSASPAAGSRPLARAAPVAEAPPASPARPPPLPLVDDQWEGVLTRVESAKGRAPPGALAVPTAPPGLAVGLVVSAVGAAPSGAAPNAVLAATEQAAPGEVAALLRAAVDEAFAPFHSRLLEWERRLAGLESRLATDSRAGHALQPMHGGALPVHALPRTGVPIDMAVYAHGTLTGAADLGAFDGRRRRRRLVVGLALMLVALFGGLFLLLAASYANTHS